MNICSSLQKKLLGLYCAIKGNFVRKKGEHKINNLLADCYHHRITVTYIISTPTPPSHTYV